MGICHVVGNYRMHFIICRPGRNDYSSFWNYVCFMCGADVCHLYQLQQAIDGKGRDVAQRGDDVFFMRGLFIAFFPKRDFMGVGTAKSLAHAFYGAFRNKPSIHFLFIRFRKNQLLFGGDVISGGAFDGGASWRLFRGRTFKFNQLDWSGFAPRRNHCAYLWRKAKGEAGEWSIGKRSSCILRDYLREYP